MSQPSDEAYAMMDLFAGLKRAHGTFHVDRADARGKVQGRAITVRSRVTAEKWQKHLDGELGIGIVPIMEDGTAAFGAIDVDVYDLDLGNLCLRVKSGVLPLVVCRTKSGGAHLYLFVDEPLPASVVRDKLMEWSVSLGYAHVEIFPKQTELYGEEDVGSWLNMPYFNGNLTTRYAVDAGHAISTVKAFLEHALALKTSLKKLNSIVFKTDEELEGGPPCLQYLAKFGFSHGTRNMSLFNLGVLCKFKFGDDWQEKLRLMNKKYFNPPLSNAETDIVIKQLKKKEYFYRCKDQPIVSVCNKTICAQREHGLKRSVDDPGISLNGITKILTEPPMWILNVNGKNVKLDSSDDLLKQSRFESFCMDSLNVIPNRVKEHVWRDLLRGLMENVEEVSAPVDASLIGQFELMLERFCLERASAESPEEIFLEKVYVRGRKAHFQSVHLLAFMDKHKLRVSAKQAWSMLRELGGTHKRIKAAGRELRVWVIDQFERDILSDPEPRHVKGDGETLF